MNTNDFTSNMYVTLISVSLFTVCHCRLGEMRFAMLRISPMGRDLQPISSHFFLHRSSGLRLLRGMRAEVRGCHGCSGQKRTRRNDG